MVEGAELDDGDSDSDHVHRLFRNPTLAANPRFGNDHVVADDIHSYVDTKHQNHKSLLAHAGQSSCAITRLPLYTLLILRHPQFSSGPSHSPLPSSERGYACCYGVYNKPEAAMLVNNMLQGAATL